MYQWTSTGYREVDAEDEPEVIECECGEVFEVAHALQEESRGTRYAICPSCGGYHPIGEAESQDIENDEIPF